MWETYSHVFPTIEMNIWCLWHALDSAWNKKFSIDQFRCWLACANYQFKDIKKFVLFNPLIKQYALHIQPKDVNDNYIKTHRKQEISLILFNNGLTLLRTNKWGHRTKGLKPRVQIKKNILRIFFSYFIKNERKESKALTKKKNVEAKHDN